MLEAPPLASPDQSLTTPFKTPGVREIHPNQKKPTHLTFTIFLQSSLDDHCRIILCINYAKRSQYFSEKNMSV